MKAIQKRRDSYAALLIIAVILAAWFTVRLQTNNLEVILPKKSGGV
jgi:hypothetical protein